MMLLGKIDQQMGGGVCIYLRNSISYNVRLDLIPSELEAVCVEIIKLHSWPFLLATVYRPLNASSEFFDHLENLIKAIDDENKEMDILGDLNCDMLKTGSAVRTKKLKSLYELHQLSQLINWDNWYNEATRVTVTFSSLIDHIVANQPEKISNSGVIHTGISDYSLVFAIRKTHIIKKQEENIEMRNMKNFNDWKFIEGCWVNIGNMFTFWLMIDPITM